MARSLKKGVESLADDIRAQAKELRTDNLLSFIYTADILNRYLEIKLRKYGANRTQLNILHALITHGGSLRPTELSKRVFRSKHAITRAIDALEEEGLVRREGVSQDRRVKLVTITRKGLQLVKEFMPHRQETSFKVMSCLSEEEAQEFSIILRRLRKHVLSLLENSGAQPKEEET